MNSLHIQRLDPAHVHHASGNPLLGKRIGSAQSLADHAAERQNGNVIAFAYHTPLSFRQHLGSLGKRDALALAARIADGERAAHRKRRMQRMHELGLVRRRQHAHVGHHAGVHQVEHAMVRGAVGTHDAGAVDGEDDIELRQRHVDDHLIDGALHERGIQRHHGFLAVCRQAAGETDSMLLANAGVHEAFRELLRELI